MKKNQKKQAVTLIELIIVVIIIGIIAGIALPEYTRSRERALDKQAQAILIGIRAAEREYRMEMGNYWPTSGSVTNLDYINGNLSLDLVDDGRWSYEISSQQGFYAELGRNEGGYGRYWWINSTITNASCVPVSGNGCP